jgi:dipeptidyl aminopeptidase/acylaminoacyl peptidase
VVTRTSRRVTTTIATLVALGCAGIPTAAATYRTEPRTLLVGLWRPDMLPYPDEGDSDLWLVEPDGTPVRRLTNTPHRDEQYPRWAPGGRRIVFTAGQYESCELYTIRPDGTGKQRMTHNGAVDGEPTWSPDGRWIAWIHRGAGTGIDELWVMRADGSDRHRVPVRVTSFTFETPMWSPDGSGWRCRCSWSGATSSTYLVSVRMDPGSSGSLALREARCCSTGHRAADACS